VVTVVTQHTYSDETIVTETVKEDADGKKSAPKKEVTLPNRLVAFMILLVLVQVVFVTMVYGPIAAFLVELFPTRIRYTSMSLPYHLGNGVFGGLVPFIAVFLVEQSKTTEMPAGDPLAGLWYPISIAAICFVVGLIYLRNKAPLSVD
jgi:MHS family proline/betaine transporter-like MFS transporter